MNRLLLLPLLLAAAVLPGCKRESRVTDPEIRRAYIGPETTPPPAPAPEERDRQACEARLLEVLAEPSVPGVPELESRRTELLVRTKGEPVYFTRRPQHGEDGASITVQGYRQLLRVGNPYGMVTRILEESEGFPQQARAALLTDGYVYAEDPNLAYALVALLQPHQLFGHDRIWIQRGDQLVHAERRSGRYYYTDGPLAGDRVRLVLFDRAGGGDEPPPPSHIDFRALRYRLNFDRVELRHVSERHVVANLRYGKWAVPTILSVNGASLSVECEVLAPHLRPEVDAHRREGARRQRVVQALRRTMLEELDEALPFDEPRHEYGFQLDGTLRGRWQKAYDHGKTSFAFFGDEYQVFDGKGRALTPQVCVDFLTDTFERTAGTWFRPRGEPPGLSVGKLDFDAVAMDRMELRRVPGFVDFARAHPEMFSVLDPEREVPLGDRAAFIGFLSEHVSDFAVGDAVLIKGKTPWDRRRVHFHSFFIYESDPLTGMPLVVVGNAGRPSLRSWETEMRRTPERAIVHRLRPTTEWLESVMAVEPFEGAPPLAAGPE